MIIHSNQSIPNTKINDCESGLSVVLQQQQPESETQEEESDGQTPKRDIENMSSNNTESVQIRIDTLDPIVNQRDSTVVSVQHQESGTTGGQSVDKSETNGFNYKMFMETMVIGFSVCLSQLVIFILPGIAVIQMLEKRSINYLDLAKLLFFFIFIPFLLLLMKWYLSRCCVKHNKVSNTR